MSIEREVQVIEKLVPIEIKFYGDMLDTGCGHISIKQAWRRPDGRMVADHERSYSLSEELQDPAQYAGLTTPQVLAFFCAYFESKEQVAIAAQAAAEVARLAEEAARLAAEAAAAAAP
jgi:hypothetical protein